MANSFLGRSTQSGEGIVSIEKPQKLLTEIVLRLWILKTGFSFLHVCSDCLLDLYSESGEFLGADFAELPNGVKIGALDCLKNHCQRY